LISAVAAAAAFSSAESTAPLFTGTSFINGQCAPFEIFPIQTGNRSFRFSFHRHLHKSKSLGLTGKFIHDYAGGCNFAERLKRLLQVILAGFAR
jgi:hypothetical protein